MEINFKDEVKKYEEDLISDLFELLKINSYLKEEKSKEYPFGIGPRRALDKILSFGKRDGYKVKNVGNVSGHIEIGEGDELFGILGHVDVVPANPDEWESDPFNPEVRDGKIFARGVLDDKGPTMAAYYAIKILDNLNVKWNKRVRLIVGTDEEVGFRCVKRYFETEEIPEEGFTPDALYPLIYGEKAQCNFRYILKFEEESKNEENEYKILSFESGLAKNIVPDKAVVKLEGNIDNLKNKLKECAIENYEVSEKDFITLKFSGQAAHGSTPELGKNAATKLAKFLCTLSLDKNAKNYMKFIASRLDSDPFGNNLELNYEDNEMGRATYNYGIFYYNSKERKAIIEADSRFPAKFNLIEKLKKLNLKNFNVDVYSNKSAHYVPKEDDLVQTLLSVYRKYTNDYKNDAMVIGGGTYARCMKKGVAFGALLPDREDTMHQANEHMYIEDLLLSVAIYAESIYKICCKKN